MTACFLSREKAQSVFFKIKKNIEKLGMFFFFFLQIERIRKAVVSSSIPFFIVFSVLFFNSCIKYSSLGIHIVTDSFEPVNPKHEDRLNVDTYEAIFAAYVDFRAVFSLAPPPHSQFTGH